MNLKYLIIIYLVINSFCFLAMVYDKFQSKRKGNRISERTLFLLAFSFGALGIYLGLKYPLYHKAAKAKFRIGVPLFLLLNAICMYLLFYNFGNSLNR